MKPRTLIEKEVVALSNDLPTLTDEQVEWGFARLGQTAYFRHRKSYAVGTYKCTECSHEWKSIYKDEIVCPHCGKTLKVEQSRKRNFKKRGNVIFVYNINNWYVFRFVYFEHLSEKRYERYSDGIFRHYSDVAQIWYNAESGKEVVLAKSSLMYWYNTYQVFALNSELSVKRYSNRYSYGFDARYTSYEGVYPVLPKRLSYVDWSDEAFDDIRIMSIMKVVASQPMAETMIKAGYIELLCAMIKKGVFDIKKQPNPYVNAARLAMKTHYQIEDNGIFMDYVEQLVKLNMDWHNPTVVCPKELHTEHNKLTNRIIKIEKEKRKKEEREAAIKDEGAYKESKTPFFDFKIQDEDDNINIEVLKSVDDFFREGTEMKHCVFANKYYRKESSLILSARQGDWDNPTKTLETIEVDLRDFRIIQSRGHCNTPSAFHDKIVSMMTDNLPRIKQICQRRQAQVNQTTAVAAAI